MIDAQTTINQMGGINRLATMIGAKEFAGGENHVQFKFMAGAKNKANRVRIELTPADLYRVVFYSIRKMEYKEKEVIDGVYCDDLVKVFESSTGLYLTI